MTSLHLSTAAKIEQAEDGLTITVKRGTRDDRELERARGKACQLLHDGRWLSLTIREVRLDGDLAVWFCPQSPPPHAQP